MKTSAVILNVCLAISMGCLGVGFILDGYWQIVPLFLAMVIFWIMLKRWSVFWSVSIFLSIYVFLAIVGVMLDHSIVPLILGCASALACWDLTHFVQSKVDNPSLDFDAPLERNHLLSLSVSVVSGLFLALLSSYLKLDFPFGATVIFVFISMGCITYGAHHMLKNR